MHGQSSLPKCWQAPLQLALPAAPVIRLRGIPARPWDHFPQRPLPRALAVHFPARSRRLPLLQDHLQGRAGAVRPAAVVVEAAEAVGKRAAARGYPRSTGKTMLQMLPMKAKRQHPLAELHHKSAM